MKYLVVQDWANTHGNHAGMVHMCKLLVKQYPNDYRMIVKDCPPERKKRKNPFIRKLMANYDEKQYRKSFVVDYMSICQEMFSKLKGGDKVFLLEYNWPSTSQYELACYIKSSFEGVEIIALSHLTPTYFKRDKNVASRILEWDKPIDKHLTLGSSLSNYFHSLGIPSNKISTGFHYVDSDYYKTKNRVEHDKITVITMGFLQRDYNMLADIVKSTSNVNWIICRGKKTDVDQYFPQTPNVQLKGYMQEDELKEMMEIADVSLNVMEDTVGSNVITTSMAMGLVLVVSDVGSVRDYCDDKNAVFCHNTAQSFIDAINSLTKKSRAEIMEMSTSSERKANSFSIDKVHSWLSAL